MRKRASRDDGRRGFDGSADGSGPRARGGVGWAGPSHPQTRGSLGGRQKSTFSCQGPGHVLTLFSRRRGDDQVSHSIELAPPAKFFAEPSSGLSNALPVALPAMSGADLQPVERVVTLCPAASAESALARRARPEMAPQAIEKPRFALENGAPFPPRVRPYRIHTSRFSSNPSRLARPSPRSGEGAA